MTDPHPRLRAVALDSTDARGLAEFYRNLLGYEYRPGDQPPDPGEDDVKGTDWLVLVEPDGAGRLGFQQVESLPRSTWPDHSVPQQLHLDMSVTSVEELEQSRRTALDLGAEQLYDRSEDPVEPLYVFADPAGHPFCIFVAPE